MRQFAGKIKLLYIVLQEVEIKALYILRAGQCTLERFWIILPTRWENGQLESRTNRSAKSVQQFTQQQMRKWQKYVEVRGANLDAHFH